MVKKNLLGPGKNGLGTRGSSRKKEERNHFCGAEARLLFKRRIKRGVKIREKKDYRREEGGIREVSTSE